MSLLKNYVESLIGPSLYSAYSLYSKTFERKKFCDFYIICSYFHSITRLFLQIVALLVGSISLQGCFYEFSSITIEVFLLWSFVVNGTSQRVIVPILTWHVIKFNTLTSLTLSIYNISNYIYVTVSKNLLYWLFCTLCFFFITKCQF